MKKLEDLYILNLNEAAMDLDEQVTEEMQRLQTEAALELCYVPLYKTGPGKIKIAFNNLRSLHKHFKDIEIETNVLAADVIGSQNQGYVKGMKMCILLLKDSDLLD